MKKIFLLLGLCIFFCIILVPKMVLSQTKESNTDAYTLGEIVVGAEKKVVESVGTVRELSSEDIQNKDARTLDEALNLLPGIIIRTGADGVPRVDLRGFRSRHVVLLLDGIPFNSTFDAQFDPTLIPVESIEKIKVSYGTHSVLYGDGGLGGVINIITKRGKKGLHGMASGEAGEGDNYLGRFSLSGGKGIVDFFLSGSIFDMNGFRLSDDFEETSEENGGLRENSDKRRNNLFANVNFALNDKLLIGAVFNYLKGEYGIPPSTIDDPTDRFADRPKYERIDNFEGYAGHLSLSYDLPGPFGVRMWGFYNEMREEDNRYDNNNYNSMTDIYTKGTFHQDNKTVIKGGSLQANCDLKSAGILTLSLNARNEGYKTEGEIRDLQLPGQGKKRYAFRDFQDENDLDIYSAALEYEVHPLKNSGFVLGYSHNWLEKDRGNDNEGSYLVGAYYDIFEKTRIRGSYARKIRFPSIRQLYDEERGDPDLTTERSNNYELGIEQQLPWNSKVSVTGFYIDVKDYIESVPTSATTEAFQNNDKYLFQGAEVAAETHFLKNLMVRAGYTYLYTKDKSPDTEKTELQYRPRHKVTFEGKYSFNFGFSAYMNVLYVADQVFYSKDTPLERKKLNDYTLVNLKLEQSLLKYRLLFYLGADNIFDVDYEESYGLPQAGRFIYGGVTVNL
jgi:vitamin B12 transporter